MTKIITEEYDANGKLVKRITEEKYDDVSYPVYPYYPTYPYPWTIPTWYYTNTTTTATSGYADTTSVSEQPTCTTTTSKID